MDIPPPPKTIGQKEYARTDFGEPPPGYIPGLGRGATGFTTTAEYVTASDMVTKVDDEVDLLNFFNTKEDDEADEIYKGVEKRMDGRRKRRRDQKEEERLRNFRRKKPKITVDFSSYKKDLEKLTEADWMGIPDAVDRSHRRTNFVKYTPVPDTVLLDQVRRNMDNTHQQSTIGVSKAKETIIKSKLTSVTDNVDGQTNIDPESYLTSLSTQLVMRDCDITDLKRAREMMAILTQTNPGSASGWIARARVEELAGKIKQARKFILEGCERVKKNQSVWLEASRLHDKDMARHILARAVENLPESEALWIAAVNLEEGNPKKQRRICKKSLELIPRSIELWKILVGLSPNNEQAKLLLSKAVDLIPHHIPFWVSLSKLEDYSNARKVLNMARKKNPHEPTIWVTAAQLEERMGNPSSVPKLIRKGVTSLQTKGVSLKRRDWIEKFAFPCEEKGYPITGQNIIESSLRFGEGMVGGRGQKRDPAEILPIWMKEAEYSEKSSGHTVTARWIWNVICREFPRSEIVWIQRVSFERRVGDSKYIDQVLTSSVKACPECELFWLMLAKYWIDHPLPPQNNSLNPHLDKAMEILKDGLRLHRDNEDFWLGMVKIEWRRSKSTPLCRKIFQDALKNAASGRIWMKYACFERNVRSVHSPEEFRIINEGLNQFPNTPKLWLMKCQYLEGTGSQFSTIYDCYREGLKVCAGSLKLWCGAVVSSIVNDKLSIARGLLSQANLRHKSDENLWMLRVKLEWEKGSKSAARSLVEKALHELPQSGRIWALSIEIEERQKWMRRVREMEERLNEEPEVRKFVELAVGLRSWREGNLGMAGKRMNNAVKLDPLWGDAWCYLHNFERIHGGEGRMKNVERLCDEKKPQSGEIWCTTLKKFWSNDDVGPLVVLRKASESIDISRQFFSSYVFLERDEDEDDDDEE